MRARLLLLAISVGWLPLAFLFDGITVLVLPVRLGAGTGDGGGGTLLGLASFVGLAVGVALQPIAGTLSDRFRSRVDRRALLWLGALPALGGLWALISTSSPLLAVVAYVLLQAGAGLMQAGQQTLIPEHV